MIDKPTVKNHYIGRMTPVGGQYSCKVVVTYDNNRKEETVFWDNTKDAVKEKVTQFLENAGVKISK